MTDQLVFDNTINLLGLVPGTSELTGTVNVDYDANTVAQPDCGGYFKRPNLH